MRSSHPAAETWAEWWRQLDLLTTHLRRVKGVNVSSLDLRNTAREAVQHYFREVRPRLRGLGVSEPKIEELGSTVYCQTGFSDQPQVNVHAALA